MSNENKAREVLIEREGRSWRWGQSSYFKRWSGLKQTVSTAALRAIAFPIALFFGVITFVFSGKREVPDMRGREFEQPKITHDLPVIDAKILQSVPNRVSQPSVNSGVVGQIKIFNLRSLSDIPVGSEVKAILQSGATNGIVKAKLISPLVVDGDLVLPEGATVFGHGASGEERLYVEFKKVITPTGQSYSIRAQAFDSQDKILGLKGSLVGSRTKKMAIGAGLGLLGGLADGLQETSGTSIWGGQQKKSLRDAALAGTSKAALDQSQVYLDEIKNAPNVIEVKNGSEFYLIFDEPTEKETSSE